MKDLSNENVIHVKKGDVEFLQFRKLLEFSDVINHAYSLGINMNFRTEKATPEMFTQKEAEEAINSYKLLSSAIGSDYLHIVKPRQKHTSNVQFVVKKTATDQPDFYSENYQATDGLITNKPQIMLATTNADCILMLFFDPVKKVIANVHSGWKGTLQRISVKTVKKMQKEYGCNPQDIICCICPSIRKCHFEVERDVKELFVKEFVESFIEETIPGTKWHIDTVAINKSILERAGVKPENIIDSNICSVCNSDQIHSYRVEGKNYGLATALIEIRG